MFESARASGGRPEEDDAKVEKLQCLRDPTGECQCRAATADGPARGARKLFANSQRARQARFRQR